VKTLLINKFKNNLATIGIFGFGYVGLPLVLRYSEIGFKVVGFDIDVTKIEFDDFHKVCNEYFTM
jgi:UDP-N-acetyl-D-glucosamine dehydrogenase